MIGFDGLVWLVALGVPLLFVQRRLHREIQAVFLLLTHRADLSLVLFSVIFFPGVLLHETSHFLVARMLGVRTGRFSLLPRPLPDGRLQLGYVETAQTDLLRDALIGVAPLVSGGLFVAYAGLAQLDLTTIWDWFAQQATPALTQPSAAGLIDLLGGLLTRDDFWLWFYLTFAVSSTMLPSRSDRRAWLPLGLLLALLVVLAGLVGAGPWLFAQLAPPLNQGLRAAAIVCAISLVCHLALVLPFYGARRLLSALTGYVVRL